MKAVTNGNGWTIVAQNATDGDRFCINLLADFEAAHDEWTAAVGRNDEEEAAFFGTIMDNLSAHADTYATDKAIKAETVNVARVLATDYPNFCTNVVIERPGVVAFTYRRRRYLVASIVQAHAILIGAE